ncbi:hypothetical protein [Pelagibacterium halotolerans]|uniref:hypothetical protein n=1 Tax=Pelagibacterium halotolerans TaxID=531813 RepID=UPI00384ACE91
MSSRKILVSKIDSELIPDEFGSPNRSGIIGVWVEEEGGGYLLYRLSMEGLVAGDTWHGSLDEVEEQIQYELGISRLNWIEVNEDPVTYCMNYFR